MVLRSGHSRTPVPPQEAETSEEPEGLPSVVQHSKIFTLNEFVEVSHEGASASQSLGTSRYHYS